MKFWYQQRTVWSVALTMLGVVSAIATIWTADPRVGATLAALSAGVAGAGNLLARQGGVQAALVLSGRLPMTPETETLVEEAQTKALDQQ